MSAATAVQSVHSGGRLAVEPVRRQAWLEVTCTPGCRNAGPFTTYGPTGADTEKYYCAACGYLMRTIELGAA